jgi:hypothetical protein
LKMAFTEPKNGHRVLSKAVIIELENDRRKTGYRAAVRKVVGRNNGDGEHYQTLPNKRALQYGRRHKVKIVDRTLGEGELDYLTNGEDRRNMHGESFGQMVAADNTARAGRSFLRFVRRQNVERIARRAAEISSPDELILDEAGRRGKGRQVTRAVLNRHI